MKYGRSYATFRRRKFHWTFTLGLLTLNLENLENFKLTESKPEPENFLKLNILTVFKWHVCPCFHIYRHKSLRDFFYFIKLYYDAIPYLGDYLKMLKKFQENLKGMLMTAFLLISLTWILFPQTYRILIYNYLWHNLGPYKKTWMFYANYPLSMHSQITLFLVKFNYEIHIIPPHVFLKYIAKNWDLLEA